MSGFRRLAAEFEESRLEDELEEGRDEITKLTRPKCPDSCERLSSCPPLSQ